jgi:hypothetical protein
MVHHDDHWAAHRDAFQRFIMDAEDGVCKTPEKGYQQVL